jgi:hypothetical protein
VDLSAWCIQGTWNGVGLSPVSVISPCEQATPPITPRVRGHDRIPPSGDLLSRASACVSAWHPREAETRPLPPCPCLAPSPPPVIGRRWLRTFPLGKFEQGFLDEYGPAQVGLDSPFAKEEPHRLRLSQQHLWFAPHTITFQWLQLTHIHSDGACAPPFVLQARW